MWRVKLRNVPRLLILKVQILSVKNVLMDTIPILSKIVRQFSKKFLYVSTTLPHLHVWNAKEILFCLRIKRSAGITPRLPSLKIPTAASSILIINVRCASQVIIFRTTSVRNVKLRKDVKFVILKT